MLVEDNRTTRRVVRSMLEELGFVVAEVASAGEARRFVAGSSKLPRVAFVDWGLPDAEGVDLIREWRAQPRMHRCALVMLTIRAQIEAINEALEAGADEFVMKPCTVEGLAAKLELLDFPELDRCEVGPVGAGDLPPRRLLIVDDSAIARRMIELALRGREDVELVGAVANGRVALERVLAEQLELLILDLEMPQMDGIELLRELREVSPNTEVIVFSSHSQRGAEQTVEALRLGARDYLLKPERMDSIEQSLDYVREQLGRRIEALGERAMPALAAPPPVASAPAFQFTPAPGEWVEPEVLLIAASTGGPMVLTQLLTALPGPLAVPVVVVQHLPEDFIPLFAEQLAEASGLHVKVAEPGEIATAGGVWLAPGTAHLRLRRDERGLLCFEHSRGPRIHGCRPAADVLFSSAARSVGDRAVAVVLTGMGTDGCEGARELVAAGGRVFAQDRDSSVVWGMPGAVTRAGLVERELEADELPDALVALVGELGAQEGRQ
nr:chemotaxis-specific protein-glutamate methyltransferase CheB [Pseudenhygromyxa sp. WMMC2535]